MLQPRWWDVTVGAGSLVIAVGLLFGFGSGDPARTAIALGSIALFIVGYAAVGRPAIGGDPGWRFVGFLTIAALAVGIGSAAVPFLAILQTLAYPLVWVVGDTRRRGILGSVVIAASVFVGFLVGGGFTSNAVVSGVATATFSVVFATALGLWIASIAEYGDERARLLAELTAAQEEVEALSRDRGAAEERERLARDIHDTLAQTLAGMVILTERASRLARDGRSDDAADALDTIEQVAREALGEARALVARTAAVATEGAFDASVERLAARFRLEAGLEIEVVQGAEPAVLDREAQVVLLRCLQESLSNVRRHAAARLVRVIIDVDPVGGARLEVADDGRGFDASASSAGYGLQGMRERVALAGGVFEVESSASGTTVRVLLPGSVPTGPPRVVAQGAA